MSSNCLTWVDLVQFFVPVTCAGGFSYIRCRPCCLNQSPNFHVPHHFRGSQGRKKLRITDESLDLELTAQTTILCANVLAVRVELWIKYVRLACGYGLRATRIASSSW